MLNNTSGVKKSLYIFLSSLLGVLLFLILHRIIATTYLLLYTVNPQGSSFGLSLVDILALDVVSLIIFLLLGAWYGIWLGLHWYNMVYEQGLHRGVSHYFYTKLWNRRESPKAESQDKWPEEFAFPKVAETNFDDSFWRFEEAQKVVKVIPMVSEVKTVPKKKTKKSPAKSKPAKQ